MWHGLEARGVEKKSITPAFATKYFFDTPVSFKQG
jgi:hypothetical protein